MRRDDESLLADLERELHALAAVAPDEIDTTLLIHPRVLNDFEGLRRFPRPGQCRAPNAATRRHPCSVASFHPDYAFADTDAPRHNQLHQSATIPDPCHLLREASLDRAVAAFPDAASIYERAIWKRCAISASDGWQALGVGAPPDDGK
jgi:hypothetical protein